MPFFTVKNVFVAIAAFAVLGTSQPVGNGNVLVLRQEQFPDPNIVNGSPVCCPVNDFLPQSQSNIQLAADALVNSGSVVVTGHTCQILSEANGSAIWVCVDGDDVDINNTFVASLAQLIMSQCPAGCGQVFTDADWNVVVSGTGGDHP